MVRCNLESPSPGTFAPKSGSLALTEHAEPATLLPSYHSCSSIHKARIWSGILSIQHILEPSRALPAHQRWSASRWVSNVRLLFGRLPRWLWVLDVVKMGTWDNIRHPKIGWFHKSYIYIYLILGNARNEANLWFQVLKTGGCWHIPAHDSRGLLLMHAVHIQIFCKMDTLRVSRVKRKHNFFLAPFVYFYIFTFKVLPKKCPAF